MQALAKSLVMYRAGRRGEELVSMELLDYKMARDPQSIPGFLEFIQERLDEGRLPAQLLESLQSLKEFVKNNQKDPNSKYFREIDY
jgi:N-glycosylase/DNA lyase